MGTPFISLLEPTRLDGYDRTKPHTQQPSHIPPLFIDAMEVRETVFVTEQQWPLECEHDADDARSCHWVTYASVNRTTRAEVRDPTTNEVTQPRQSETRSMPIGTLRIVPFPHPPHPPPGGRYVDGELQQEADDEVHASPADERRENADMPFGNDRATTFHDGREPYVGVGRVAVVPEFRGHRVADQLWAAAKRWLEENPAYFNPSVSSLGMDRLEAAAATDIPKWNGLVCTHAQEAVVKVYQRWGFQVDEGMGKWTEQGIPHVGMFMRLQVKETDPKI
ncbi:Uu.00g074040.m01.CDS01 [Anthostomella pinea]|uniref:Uu.00g074040.m01.CDS01 n=1 Tax=Anthostomella pinea TaxID=933095 RepID=A0AAI8YNW3_9PEZI|nr:Uu.00g074040.m01.CDS01 [Anthostomella pinea]